ncbi:hypothetical protein ILYODFUR_020426 [Ilyodon furcidens]|uniref:Uncharacterized protein n=1 Tax=Ilyodon furcidens TaxID=33524 RepID=A0ABV0UX02_9TELE
MPTHTAPQAHVIWNCIFPVVSYISLSHTQPLSLSLSPALLSVFHIHKCCCLYSEHQIPTETELAAMSPSFILYSSFSLRLLQLKLKAHFTAPTGKRLEQHISCLVYELYKTWS